MMDNRTISILTDSVEAEFSWRIKELSNYRNNLLTSKSDLQKSLIRGGVVLLYAHWEGFVKEVTEHYYNFVFLQRLILNELRENFIAISLRKNLNSLIDSKKISLQIETIKFIKRKLSERAILPSSVPFKTSNLNFDVFSEYCLLLGLDITKFELKKNFINIKLVENRHKIAHGRFLRIDAKDFEEIYDITVKLITEIKTEVLNSAALNNYRN